ncbi:hypothetical protein NC77_27315 [Janthinobacterium lividum]|nr:hypothetical protein NC77_27315 [Janthinobacterium lividum]
MRSIISRVFLMLLFVRNSRIFQSFSDAFYTLQCSQFQFSFFTVFFYPTCRFIPETVELMGNAKCIP